MKTHTRCLTLLTLLLVLLLTLCACDDKNGGKQDKDATATTVDDDTSENPDKEPLYTFTFVSNGDNTATIIDIQLSQEATHGAEPFDITFPNESPSGEIVTAVKLDFLALLVPQLILGDDFQHHILTPLQEAVEAGEMTQFEYDQVLNHWSLIDVGSMKDYIRGDWLAKYPFLKDEYEKTGVYPLLYQFRENVSKSDTLKTEKIIMRFTEYTFEQMEKDHAKTDYNATTFNPANIRSLVLPETLTDLHIPPTGFLNLSCVEWENGVAYLGRWALGYDEDTIPNELTIRQDTVGIATSAFKNCQLTNITIPDTVMHICSSAFSSCEELTNIAIPNGVTSIGDSAFYFCNSLTSITIPDSVTSIGHKAFFGCDSLSTVYYGGTVEDWSDLSIGSSNSNLTSATIYYYSETAPTDDGNYWCYVDGVPTPW